MPAYIDAILREKNKASRPTATTTFITHVPIQYENQPQLADTPDKSAALLPTNPIQPARIISKLLYYARAVGSTLCVALSALASKPNQPTLRTTERKILHLLDYCASTQQPDAQLPFQASDRILDLQSDAGYNNEIRGRSRSGGHLLFLGTNNAPCLATGAQRGNSQPHPHHQGCCLFLSSCQNRSHNHQLLRSYPTPYNTS